jgi:hypothetical protein
MFSYRFKRELQKKYVRKFTFISFIDNTMICSTKVIISGDGISPEESETMGKVWQNIG